MVEQTVTGKLVDGFEYQGQTHFDFEMGKVKTAGDMFNAEIESGGVYNHLAFNGALMARLESLTHPITLQNTTNTGISPEWVEGYAFAWLAKQCLEGLPGNCPAVTGASKAVVLGTICPA